MEKTIIVSEISEKNGWYNLKSTEGTEISVMQAKCPKLVEQLKNARAGSEVTGNLVIKDGKSYLWDLDEKKGGSKSFAPKDKQFDAAIAAITAASSLYSLDKDKDATKVVSTAEIFHAFLMSKVTKPTS